MNVIIIGCSRRKRPTLKPMHALDLYQGGCVPEVRLRLGGHGDYWSKVFILSAKHGLLRADDFVETYDELLSMEKANALRPTVWRNIQRRVLEPYDPKEVVVLLEPLYLVLIADLLSLPSRPRVFWEPDPELGWPRAGTILDAWGWPA